MIRKPLSFSAVLPLVLALGACGGADETVVEPVAEEPVAIDASEATEAAVDDVAVELEEAGNGVEGAVAEAGEALEDAADDVGDGWAAMQDDWQNSTGLVRERWADLSEEEILDTDGDRDRLVGLVQERYGIERDQAEQEVNDWAATL